MLLAANVSPSSSPDWFSLDSNSDWSLGSRYFHSVLEAVFVPILAPNILVGTLSTKNDNPLGTVLGGYLGGFIMLEPNHNASDLSQFIDIPDASQQISIASR